MEDFGKDGKKNSTYERCGKIFAKKEQELKGFEEERQAGFQGQPAREYLEQVKCFDDKDCTDRVMQKGFTALKGAE